MHATPTRADADFNRLLRIEFDRNERIDPPFDDAFPNGFAVVVEPDKSTESLWIEVADNNVIAAVAVQIAYKEMGLCIVRGIAAATETPTKGVHFDRSIAQHRIALAAKFRHCRHCHRPGR